ncbi:MAG: UPF0147 family protein [Promethearchaeota archaeon]
MSRKKFNNVVEETFNNVKILLQGMLNDRSVPRNIKRVAQLGIRELESENETAGIIASNVMYLVDDLSQDPNIPFHSRTVLYRIISLLETVKD